MARTEGQGLPERRRQAQPYNFFSSVCMHCNSCGERPPHFCKDSGTPASWKSHDGNLHRGIRPAGIFFCDSRQIGSLAVQKDEDSLTGTVLVVEDDRLFRASLCELLGTFGLDAKPVGDAEEAVRALRKSVFDAVITDMDIPGDGATVLKYAELLRPETPVIVLTALPPSRVPAKTAFRRLFKPASVGEIRNALIEAFDGKPN